MFAAGYFIIGHSGFAALSDTTDKAVDKAKDETPAVVQRQVSPFRHLAPFFPREVRFFFAAGFCGAGRDADLAAGLADLAGCAFCSSVSTSEKSSCRRSKLARSTQMRTLSPKA